jgi:hypothetical protein
MALIPARHPPARDWLAWLVEKLYAGGALCAGTLMILLFAVAFWEIGKALLVFFHVLSPRDSAVPLESLAMTTALKGIEYMFLAPMSFLVYRSLANYVADRALGHQTPEVESEVTETKRLVTSLMFAVVATDLIGKSLSPDGLTARAPTYELCLLVIFGAYLFLLHHMNRQNDK